MVISAYQMTTLVKSTGVTQFDNISIYNDDAYNTNTRRARWAIFVDGVIQYDSGFVTLAASLPIGTGSTGNQILTPRGVTAFREYLLAQGVNTTDLTKIELGLQVKSTGTGETSDWKLLTIQSVMDWQRATEHPRQDAMPGCVFKNDALAFLAGVKRYEYYRLAADNDYDGSRAYELWQLRDPS